MRMTISNFNMDFQFTHQFDSAESKVEEEWGVGTIQIKNAQIVIEFKPLISAERLRLSILNVTYQSSDFSIVLRSPEQSRFQEVI